MNPLRRQNSFKSAIRDDEHFAIEEVDGFVKILYRASEGWQLWCVLRRRDFDKLLEDALQTEKAEFLDALIKHDVEEINDEHEQPENL